MAESRRSQSALPHPNQTWSSPALHPPTSISNQAIREITCSPPGLFKEMSWPLCSLDMQSLQMSLQNKGCFLRQMLPSGPLLRPIPGRGQR